MTEPTLIAIVDDDQAALQATVGLVRALGFAAAGYPGATAYLESGAVPRTACLVVEARSSGMDGIALFEHLAATGSPVPAVLVTAYPVAAVRARAMRAGVECYLAKPFQPADLLACIRAAITHGPGRSGRAPDPRAAGTGGRGPSSSKPAEDGHKQRRPDMPDPKLEVLTPQNSQLIFIDHQPQMAFGVQSIDRQMLKNNTVALAKSAKIFDIPTTITTVETESFSGYTYPELLDVFPDKVLLERTSMNSWDDQKVRDALAANGRKKVVVSGLWTEVCNNTFALSAMLEGGYEIYMVSDASGGTSKEAHDYAMLRMIQAGVVPMTWQKVLLEWQRDWARRDTYDAVIALVAEHSGAYGMGVDYAYTLVHKAPQRTAVLHQARPPVAAA